MLIIFIYSKYSYLFVLLYLFNFLSSSYDDEINDDKYTLFQPSKINFNEERNLLQLSDNDQTKSSNYDVS